MGEVSDPTKWVAAGEHAVTGLSLLTPIVAITLIVCSMTTLCWWMWCRRPLPPPASVSEDTLKVIAASMAQTASAVTECTRTTSAITAKVDGVLTKVDGILERLDDVLEQNQLIIGGLAAGSVQRRPTQRPVRRPIAVES